MHSSTPGDTYAQPGTLQLGYFAAGQAQWLGPFIGTTTIASRPTVVRPGDTITVTSPVASQLAISDPSWWTLH